LTLLEKVRKLGLGGGTELIAISYCLIAPKRLAERITAPPSLGA
jgi:hypothetical protein